MLDSMLSACLYPRAVATQTIRAGVCFAVKKYIVEKYLQGVYAQWDMRLL